MSPSILPKTLLTPASNRGGKFEKFFKSFLAKRLSPKLTAKTT
jgi:hypothetical protein